MDDVDLAGEDGDGPGAFTRLVNLYHLDVVHAVGMSSRRRLAPAKHVTEVFGAVGRLDEEREVVDGWKLRGLTGWRIGPDERDVQGLVIRFDRELEDV